MSAPRPRWSYTPDGLNPYVEVTQEVYDQLKAMEAERPPTVYRVRRSLIKDTGLPYTELDEDPTSVVLGLPKGPPMKVTPEIKTEE